MKKQLALFIMIFIFLVGCGGSGFTYILENEPVYKEGEKTEIVLRAEDDDGEVLQELELAGQLQMEKEDQGTLQVDFINNGDGTYTGEVQLPKAGEWILEVKAENEGEEDDFVHLIRLEIEEK